MAQFKIPKEEKVGKTEYVSISEFARMAGVSRQAIQQRLDKSLSGFVKVTQGKKTLNVEGLQLFDSASLAQGDDKENDKLAQGLIEVLQATIDTLQGQLSEKDRQLAEKDRQIGEKDKQLAGLNDRLADLSAALVSVQQLAESAQALHAGTIQRQLVDAADRDAGDTGTRKKKRWFGRDK